MIILVQHKPERRLSIVSKSYSLIFKAVRPPEGDHSRPLCAIELLPKSQLKGPKFEKLTNHEIHGFLGLIEIDHKIFICAITGKSKVANPIIGETVNKIYAVDFFCLNDERWDHVELDSNGYPIIPEDDYNSISLQSMKHPCHDLKKLLSNGSFYYSSDFDLTSLLQTRGFGTHSLSFDNYQEEYMWNYFLMQETISFRDRLDDRARQVLDDEGFLTTVIRGFAETFPSYINQLPVYLTIISKQSWKRAGTRFNARGMDDEGNVANFVETEFIMYSSEYCYALTEIRGSVPVFWEQDTSLINPKVQITRSIEATQPIFDSHFLKLIERYGPIHIINLLSTKSSEAKLSKNYREHLSNSKKIKLGESVFLTEFDFHRETKDEGFSAASKIKSLIESSLLENGYFSYDIKQCKVISMQRGVFRTNCLDCLDRTNLIQQFISRYAFKVFLDDFQLIKSNSQNIEDLEWFQKHNNLWADHGDAISQIYTGTNALKSSFSRKGKMSLAGALSDATKSVSRMYINNFMDKNKQLNIDTLLGRLPHQQAVQLYDPINEYITSKLKELSNNYTSSSTIKLLVGTFNVNGLTKKTDINSWLYPIGNKYIPDIVILGMQEVIELSAGSILNADYSKSVFWQQLVNNCLNQYNEKYLLLRAEQMSSLLILFFVKADKVNNVKRVEGSSKKTGLGGITGNKGAVSIRFEYGSTSFCFINAHLAAGVSNVDERRADYESITNGITFSRSKKISHHDSIFWLGDLNYRIGLPNEQVRKILHMQEEGYIEQLLRYDQLTQEMSGGQSFIDFMEPSIQFHPTYKYDHGSDNYDTSEKARTPSWTDRIIYKGNNLQPMAYGDVKILDSDHRPVYSAYKVIVNFIDESIKAELSKKLYLEFKATHPEEISTTDALIYIETERQKDQKRSRVIPPSQSTGEIDLLGLELHNDGTHKITDLTTAKSNSNLILSSLVNPNSVADEQLSGSIKPPPSVSSRSISPALSQYTKLSTHHDCKTDTDILVPTPKPPGPRKKVVPPGFSDTILIPKNGNSSVSISSSASVSTCPQALRKVSTENSIVKKEPPIIPLKKPELSVMDLKEWKPLIPK